MGDDAGDTASALILSRLNSSSGALDLRHASAASWIAGLDTEGWQLLQRYASAEGGNGIRQVCLPSLAPERMRAAVTGLRQLDTLRTVVLTGIPPLPSDSKSAEADGFVDWEADGTVVHSVDLRGLEPTGDEAPPGCAEPSPPITVKVQTALGMPLTVQAPKGTLLVSDAPGQHQPVLATGGEELPALRHSTEEYFIETMTSRRPSGAQEPAAEPPSGSADYEVHIAHEGGRELDLTNWPADTHITITGAPPREPLLIRAQAGVQVRADFAGVSRHKAEVTHTDGKRWSDYRTLPGQIYVREPLDYEYKAARQGIDPQTLAFQTQLNGAGKWQTGQSIVCRHLTMHWLAERAAYIGQKLDQKQPAPEKFTYAGKLDSKEAISQKVPQTTEDDFDWLVQQQPLAVFSASGFGDALAKGFEGMAPGSVRQLSLMTGNHAIGVELQVKQRGAEPPEYVVTVYDPNLTAHHLRLVETSPDRLKGMGLDKWFSVQALQAYGGSEPRIFALTRWRDLPGEGVRAPRQEALTVPEFMNPAEKLSPHYVHWAMQTQTAPELRKWMLSVIAMDRLAPHERLRILAGRDAPAGGMHTQYAPTMAMVRDGATIGAYYRTLLTARDDQLPASQRQTVLRSQSVQPTASGLRSMDQLEHALRTRPDVAREQTQAILDARADTLTRPHRLELLMACNGNGRPAVHSLAIEDARLGKGGERNTDRLYHHLRQIFSDPKLSADDKAVLAGSTHDGMTAARAAMMWGRSRNAAAILRAVVDCTMAPQDKQALLQEVGVTAEEVLGRLARTDTVRLALTVGLDTLKKQLDATDGERTAPSTVRSGPQPDTKASQTLPAGVLNLAQLMKLPKGTPVSFKVGHQVHHARLMESSLKQLREQDGVWIRLEGPTVPVEPALAGGLPFRRGMTEAYSYHLAALNVKTLEFRCTPLP